MYNEHEQIANSVALDYDLLEISSNLTPGFL